MNYIKAKALYESARDKVKGKPIGNNLYMVKYGKGYGVQLHNTVIAVFTPDNRVSIFSGGWQTVTTKKRINEYLPQGYFVSQRKHVWTLHCPDGVTLPWVEGLRILNNE